MSIKLDSLSRSLSRFFPDSIAIFTIVSGDYHTPDDPKIIFDISCLLKENNEGYDDRRPGPFFFMCKSPILLVKGNIPFTRSFKMNPPSLTILASSSLLDVV